MAAVSARRNKDGSVTWRVNFRVGKSQVQDSFIKEADARAHARLVGRLGGEAARAILAARVGATAEMPTLAEYTARYLDYDSGLLVGVSDGTRAGYEAIARRSFLQQVGDLPIDAVTRNDVGRWIAWQARQPSSRHKGETVSAKTIRNYHALLSAVLASAAEEKLIPENPARGVRLPSGRKREGVFLTAAEVQAIVDSLPERHRPLVRFLVSTGCRWGEATALTWADVNADSKPPTVRINKAWKKGAKGAVLGAPKSPRAVRTISLWASAIADLGERGKPSELVFANSVGGRIEYRNFQGRAWKPAVEKADIGKQPTIHDLRHTSASLLIASGTPLPFIQARLGHERITTTVDVYGHLVPEAHQEMSFAMQNALRVDPKAISG